MPKARIPQEVNGEIQWECSRCFKFKPAGEFNPNPATKSGRASWCIECHGGYMRRKQATAAQRGQCAKRKAANRRLRQKEHAAAVAEARRWELPPGIAETATRKAGAA